MFKSFQPGDSHRYHRESCEYIFCYLMTQGLCVESQSFPLKHILVTAAPVAEFEDPT